MILRPDQVIAGRPAKDIRKFLREILHLQVSCGYAQHILRCPKEEAKQVMTALEKEGYLSRAARHEGHDLYATTLKGNQLAGANLRPISRTTAEKTLKAFMQRVRMVNANPDYLETISGDLRILTKNSPAQATGAHISIIGHITRDELRRHLDSTDMANGFANRFFWLCVKRSKYLPDDEQRLVAKEKLDPLVERLRAVIRFASGAGEMRKDENAQTDWRAVYKRLSDGKPGLLGAITSRAEAQVMRLACINALTAVIWYVLAIVCLFLLRRKEPELFRPYKVPAYPWMPLFVALLSVIAAFLYVWVNVKVIVPTACLFIAAAFWYGLWARRKVLPVAPEEVTARIAAALARHEQPATPGDLPQRSFSSAEVIERPTGPIVMPADPLYRRQAQALLERVIAPVLLLGVLSLLWMTLRGLGARVWAPPERVEVTLALAVWGLLFILISAIGLLSTLRNQRE